MKLGNKKVADKKNAEVKEDKVFSNFSCSGHDVYCVEARTKRLGEVFNDENGIEILNNEWSVVRHRRLSKPEMVPQFPSDGDIIIPKACSALSYTQAMAQAWLLACDPLASGIEIRVRRMTLTSKWEATYEDESMATEINKRN